jgi:hypothetical protein
VRDAIVSAVPSRVINIDDLRQKAQARLPRIVSTISTAGPTTRSPCARTRVYDDVVFRPRFGVALPDVTCGPLSLVSRFRRR